jgi:hypothetical protein
MPYDDEQLMSWYDELAEGRPPTGMTSLGVDTDGGVLELVLRSDHDEAALQRLLRRVPTDAVRVVMSSATWHGYGPTAASADE